MSERDAELLVDLVKAVEDIAAGFDDLAPFRHNRVVRGQELLADIRDRLQQMELAED